MTFGPAAVVVLRDDGDVVTALGSRYRYKVVGAATNGAYSLVEETLLDDVGPPLHVHDREEEAFYVLSGRGVFVVGEEHRELGPGDLVVVPRGAPHALARLGGELRMLVISSPPGLEQFFVEVERRESAAGEPMSEDEVVALAAAYGTRIVGPPIGPLPADP